MVEKKDVDAALQARAELGTAYEPEIVEVFLAIVIVNPGYAHAWRR